MEDWALNSSFQVFVSPQIHFQCQIFNVNFVWSFFLIVFELVLNKRVNVWPSSVYRQVQTVFYQYLKLFLQRVVLILNFNLNSVWIWINLLFLLQLLQQLTELVISGNFLNQDGWLSSPIGTLLLLMLRRERICGGRSLGFGRVPIIIQLRGNWL